MGRPQIAQVKPGSRCIGGADVRTFPLQRPEKSKRGFTCGVI